MPAVVVGQRQTTVIDDAGQITPVMAVTFKTEKGLTGIVDVPLSQYNVENVRKAVGAKAATLDGVHGMEI